MQIGDNNSWERVLVPGRPDFIGVRGSDGDFELLTHNEGDDYPYRITKAASGWTFKLDGRVWVQTEKP